MVARLSTAMKVHPSAKRVQKRSCGSLSWGGRGGAAHRESKMPVHNGKRLKNMMQCGRLQSLHAKVLQSKQNFSI